MKIFLLQLQLELKIFFRDYSTVFWTFFFPAILMLFIGWIFNEKLNQSKFYLYDENSSEFSKKIIKQIKKIKKLNVIFISNKNDFNTYINNNKGYPLIHIPKNFEKKIKSKKNVNLNIYYNNNYESNKKQGLFLFYESYPLILQVIKKQSNLIFFKKKTLTGKNKSLSYIDYLCPGIISMSIMSTCLFGVGIVLTSHREKKKLRRFALTPLPKWIYILSYILHRYIIVLIQGTFLIFIAFMILDIKFYGDFLSLIIIITIGLLTFLSMGFMIASRAKKSDTASAFANIIFIPMLLLGEVYFPINQNHIPDIIKPIINILPLSHLTKSLREIINHGKPFYQLTEHLIPQILVMTFCFIISLKTFRWE